jgi:hypothetical protein
LSSWSGPQRRQSIIVPLHTVLAPESPISRQLVAASPQRLVSLTHFSQPETLFGGQYLKYASLRERTNPNRDGVGFCDFPRTLVNQGLVRRWRLDCFSQGAMCQAHS